jgi:SAM-dependent methyltransferase
VPEPESRLSPTPFRSFGTIDRLYGDESARSRALAADPGLCNVLGYERAFAADPVGMDFLNPASPFFHLKALSTRIYLDIIEPYLKDAPPGGRALDVGCGVGRFTLPLAERFAEVTAFDACRSAVECFAERLRVAGRNNVALKWADLAYLADLPAATFDVHFALELVCYTAAPAHTLEHLLRVSRSGAVLFLSAEALPGALCGVDLPGPSAVADALAGRPVVAPGDRWVRYYDTDELVALTEAAGWQVETTFGAHYFGEGPLWQALDDARLDEPEYVRQVLDAEAACRADARLRNLARAVGVVARKA